MKLAVFVTLPVFFYLVIILALDYTFGPCEEPKSTKPDLKTFFAGNWSRFGLF